MAVFKKLKKSKEKHSALPDPEPAKQLDKRVGLDTYRDFFTLKNYWKAIDRRRVDAGNHLLQSEKLLEADGLKFAEPVKHIKVFEGIPIEVGKAAISEVESRFLLCPLCASAGDMSFCIHLADA